MTKKTSAGRKGRERAYSTWAGMKARCSNPNEPGFRHYGGRGIAVCERWQEFEGFYADMGEPPDGYSLERIDNEKGYSPENCKWATRTEQNNNTRVNVRITALGQTLTATQWARRLGVPAGTIFNHRSRGTHTNDLIEWLAQRYDSQL